MEAASFRMAARDRFGAMGDPGPSHLQRYIQQACSPENFEPNLALNLEISDLINSKKGTAPREAAVAIVNYINHRNPNVALLALNLLDICVKNCGYPFHLQISTKEFLNELVRRFPERPPIRPTRVQRKILGAIEEWRGTICQTSRYKEDLGFIRDMHRLLSYKGYVFPEVRREDAAVLNPSDNLKSADEMEEEEREAQSAKLQELIRRGGPEDLQEANRLMKVMAGYDTRMKTDYRAKAAEEVGKIQQKARLLEERLENFKSGDKMSEGDVYEELASALQSAQPKIQKMCEEESDDHEAVAKLLEINDSIHRTVERYKLMKKGDVEGANRIDKGTLGTTTGVGKNADNELSLIDFGGEEPNGSSSAAAQSQAGGLEDDLLGLSLGSSSFGQGGGITLGGTPSPSFTALSSTPPISSSSPANLPQSAPPPTSAPAPAKPNYSAFSAFESTPSSTRSTPQPSLFQQQAGLPQPAPPPSSDPFAALATPKFTNSSPASSSLLDLGAPAPAPAPTTGKTVATDDDEEWSFSSALPEGNGLPLSNTVTVSNAGLNVVLRASRSSPSDATVNLALSFSNKLQQPITELTFQAAVTKGFNLQMQPQTGRDLKPLESNGIRQMIQLHGAQYGQASNVKMRWKVSYMAGGQAMNEQGSISSLGIA